MFKVALTQFTVGTALLLVSAPVFGQLREADVLRAASSRFEIARAEAEAERARRAAEGAGRLPNPTLGFERQEAYSPNAQSQDLLSLTWPIQLSGRAATERALAEVDASMAEVELERARLELLARSLELFYVALGRAQRTAHLESGVEVLTEAERLIQSRQAAGDASGYETERIGLELSFARSRAAQARLEAAAARAELGALVGTDDAPLGDFQVDAPAPESELMTRARRERRDGLALDAWVSSATDAQRRSRRGGLPDLALIVGYNRQRAPTGHGYALGAEITLPFFDRNQGPRGEADALADRAQIVRDTWDRRVLAEVRGARARLDALLRERERFSTTDAGSLVQAAIAAYREGERTLVELIDARRAAMDVLIRRTELDLQVRLADVALRRATGELR